MSKKEKETFIYVLYKNGKYSKVNVNKFEYSKKIEMCMIPLDVVGKDIYLPVNPKYFGNFHHGKISMTIRHNMIDWDLAATKEDEARERWDFHTEKEFSNACDFFSYLHTIHRIKGMELIRSYGYTEVPDMIVAFDVPFVEVRIYDKDKSCIYHEKYKNFEEITYTKLETDSFYIRHNSEACERFNELISINRLVPFGSYGILIHQHQMTWEVNSKEQDYSKSQFVPMEEFHCFYLDTHHTIDAFWTLVDTYGIIPHVSTYTISVDQIMQVSPEALNDDLAKSIESGDFPYYDCVEYSNLDFPMLIELLVFYRVFAQYTILESAYCIFGNDDRYNLVIDIELQFNNSHNRRRIAIPSNLYPNSFRKLLEVLLS